MARQIDNNEEYNIPDETDMWANFKFSIQDKTDSFLSTNNLNNNLDNHVDSSISETPTDSFHNQINNL